jgi:hypothetical protein
MYRDEHPADVAALVMQPRMHGGIPSVPVGAGAVSVVVPWAVTAAAAMRATKSWVLVAIILSLTQINIMVMGREPRADLISVPVELTLYYF